MSDQKTLRATREFLQMMQDAFPLPEGQSHTLVVSEENILTLFLHFKDNTSQRVFLEDADLDQPIGDIASEILALIANNDAAPDETPPGVPQDVGEKR